MTPSTLFILGAPDPEMAAIEKLLTEAGVPYAYASIGGTRVHPGNAYRTHGYMSDEIPYLARVTSTVYTVECKGDLIDCGFDTAEIRRIDHHRPGDPGYGRPPAEFLAASSVGQVICLLAKQCLLPDSWEEDWQHDCRRPHICFDMRDNELSSELWAVMPPEDVVLAAAADHCLESAYRGLCPGVDPERLMRWRAESRAAFQGRTVEAVLADVESARRILQEAIAQGDREFADLRGFGIIPELPEAACREGIPFLAEMADRDGRRKVVLQAAPPDLVARFLAGEVVPGLVDTYGDPARGFAGGYIK
jgi:hypothetical protein